MKSASAERVVVYRLGSLGDTVVVLPCLHAVARAYPDAERIMLTNFPVSQKAAPVEAILGGSDLLHRFMAYPVGTRSFSTLRALRRSLRAFDARTLIYLTPSRGLLSAWRDLLFFKLCGFTHIVGIPMTRDLQENRRGTDGFVEWECQRLARCVADLGPIVLEDRTAWDLRLTDAERAAARASLGPIADQPHIAINMGGKVVANDWGEANWMAMVKALREKWGDHALVFIGATEDAERARRVGALWPGAVANLCGRVSPRVSAAAMSGAQVFVGHDSGPLHLASCMGVACVGLYGSHNEPRKWHPFGPGHRIIHDMRGVSSIRVGQVARAVEDELALARTHRPFPRHALEPQLTS